MGIYTAGFERPSPIQEQAVPMALSGRDILGQSWFFDSVSNPYLNLQLAEVGHVV